MLNKLGDNNVLTELTMDVILQGLIVLCGWGPHIWHSFSVQ